MLRGIRSGWGAVVLIQTPPTPLRKHLSQRCHIPARGEPAVRLGSVARAGAAAAPLGYPPPPASLRPPLHRHPRATRPDVTLGWTRGPSAPRHCLLGARLRANAGSNTPGQRVGLLSALLLCLQRPRQPGAGRAQDKAGVDEEWDKTWKTQSGAGQNVPPRGGQRPRLEGACFSFYCRGGHWYSDCRSCCSMAG